MSLEYELEPKLKEIHRLTLEWYTDFLRLHGFKFDANGSVIVDPERDMGPALGAPPLSREEREQPMRENWRILNDSLTELLNRFRAFYGLDPLDYTVLVGKLGGTQGGVAPADGFPTSVHDWLNYADDQWMSRVDGMINEGQWSGPAATVFHEQFLFRFHAAVEQQKAYARELGLAAQSYHDAVAAAAKDLHHIADACIARLGGHRDDSESLTALSVISIVAGALAFFPPFAVAAGSVSLGTSIISFIASEAASEDATPPTVSIGGSEPRSIIQSTWDAIVKLEGLLADVDETLSRGLNQDLQSTASFASPGLKLPRPDIADQPGTLGRLKIQSAPGVPPAESPVVVSIVDLYKAGYVNLPGAAHEYDRTAAKLGSCAVPAALSRFFPRSIPRFDEARDVLAGILRNTHDSLTDAGAALVQSATGYQLTDEEKAEAIRQIGTIPEPSFGDDGGTPLRGPI